MVLFLNGQLFKRAVDRGIKIQKLNLSSHQAKLKELKVPSFKVNSRDIFLITEPTEFHSKILNLIALSNKRIVLSSLYIGTGDLEQNLVNQLHNQLKVKPQLNATILLDYNRGCRLDKDGNSSRTLLAPLLKESFESSSTFGQQASKSSSDQQLSSRVLVNFFLSPDFSNIFLKNALLSRQKYNEIISLQHIKVYLFDDDFIISGANLNEQYFTNRQDRYIYIRNCPQLADYLEQLIRIVGNISMHLNVDGSLSCELDPLDERNKEAIQLKLRDEIEQLNGAYFAKSNTSKHDDASSSTIIYPLLQMKKFNVNTDETFTSFLLNSLTATSKLYLASGYFNLTSDYQRSIFRTASKQPACSVELIMASEKVNSFYKAKGPIQYIPSIYTQLPNWTFHAKGLWLLADTTSSNRSSDYFLSLIGSPNFGYRSVYKDLELQMAIFTKDDDLIKQFLDEYENIRRYATLINTPDELPFVSYWIRIATKFVKRFC